MSKRVFLTVHDGDLYWTSERFAMYFDLDHKEVSAYLDNCYAECGEYITKKKWFIPLSTVKLNGEDQMDYLISPFTITRLLSFFNINETDNELCHKVDAKFGRMRLELRELSKLDQFQINEFVSQALLDLELTIVAMQEQLNKLLLTSKYITVKDYADIIDCDLNVDMVLKLNKACVKLCEELGIRRSEEVEKLHEDAESYPTEIVKKVFDSYLLFD